MLGEQEKNKKGPEAPAKGSIVLRRKTRERGDLR